MDRWSWVLEQKPRPVLEVLKDEVAKLLEKELRRWPLPVEELDPAYAARHASAFALDAPRPALAVYRQAFLLARWELEREVLAVDEYFRNERYLEAGLGPTDKPALLVLSRWLTEQMLALAEATAGRVKRPDLVDMLERTQQLWLSWARAS
ncbi:MAG: hypothetical protein RL653_4541 [Pseudomonadota bacterium]